MMLGLRIGAAVLIVSILPSCAMTTQAADQPATIISPSAESRAELQHAVATALGRPVTLADDALTGESVLTIERATARDPSGRVIEARERNLPERFQLVRNGNACVLIHERTQARIDLPKTRCK